MIWLNFERWSSGGGKFFSSRRIYLKGYIWTPFVVLKKDIKVGLVVGQKKEENND